MPHHLCMCHGGGLEEETGSSGGEETPATAPESSGFSAIFATALLLRKP